MKRLDLSSLRVRLILLIILASIPAMLLTINHAVEERSSATAQMGLKRIAELEKGGK